jgi:hypothetical protein
VSRSLFVTIGLCFYSSVTLCSHIITFPKTNYILKPPSSPSPTGRARSLSRTTAPAHATQVPYSPLMLQQVATEMVSTDNEGCSVEQQLQSDRFSVSANDMTATPVATMSEQEASSTVCAATATTENENVNDETSNHNNSDKVLIEAPLSRNDDDEYQRAILVDDDLLFWRRNFGHFVPSIRHDLLKEHFASRERWTPWVHANTDTTRVRENECWQQDWEHGLISRILPTILSMRELDSCSDDDLLKVVKGLEESLDLLHVPSSICKNFAEQQQKNNLSSSFTMDFVGEATANDPKLERLRQRQKLRQRIREQEQNDFKIDVVNNESSVEDSIAESNDHLLTWISSGWRRTVNSFLNVSLRASFVENEQKSLCAVAAIDERHVHFLMDLLTHNPNRRYLWRSTQLAFPGCSDQELAHALVVRDVLQLEHTFPYFPPHFEIPVKLNN